VVQFSSGAHHLRRARTEMKCTPELKAMHRGERKESTPAINATPMEICDISSYLL